MTFQQIIHSYTNLVFQGKSDDDLTPKQRYFLGVLLNLTANKGLAYTPYAQVDRALRTKLETDLREFAWNAQSLFRGEQANDFSTATARAIECLRNI